MKFEPSTTQLLFKIRLLSNKTLLEYSTILNMSIFEYLSYENGNKELNKTTLNYICDKLQKEFYENSEIKQLISILKKR